MIKENQSAFDWIIFDLGGVLVELGGISEVIGWSKKIHDEASLWNCWLSSPTIMAFESGKMSMDDFISKIYEELELDVPLPIFMESFNNWPKKLYPNVKNFLNILSKSHKLGCLSNTSSQHWKKMCQEMDLSTFFDLSFLSFQMGCVKPHPDIFQKVIKALRVPPAKILYFDDNLINVEAAKAAGIQGVHTKGFSEVQTYLTQALDL